MNKYNSQISNIAFTGMMLSLVLLFQYLEKFMPIGSLYVKINFSLLFVLAVFVRSGFKYGILILLLRLAIGPLISIQGYSPITLWAHFVLFISTTIFLTIFFIGRSFFTFENKNRHIVLGISVLATSVIMAFLNGLILSPMYWYIYGWADQPTISAAKVIYSDPFVQAAFLEIKNYWVGMMSAFTLGNLIKYSLIAIIFIPFQSVMNKIK